jgi:hypothetical protein
MTLFFELISTGVPAQPLGVRTADATENLYKVTGVYIMGNGTAGTVSGQLGGALNPLETGGTFTGSLTATTPSGCTATRDFSGTLTSQTLNWTGGPGGTSTCSPSPLGFSDFSMLRADPSAPLPTTTIATTTTSIATTSIVCTYSLSPTSLTVASTGGPQTVTITTPAGCGWSAQTFADWITVVPPSGGTGPATVTFNVQPTTVARVGTLLIAGFQFTVTQSAPVAPPPPQADLEPVVPPDAPCSFDDNRELPYFFSVSVANRGNAAAGPSSLGVDFTVGTDPAGGVPTAGIAAGLSVPVEVTIPDNCFQTVGGGPLQRCTFGLTADVGGVVAESNETNNASATPASCTRSFTIGAVSGRS